MMKSERGRWENEIQRKVEMRRRAYLAWIAHCEHVEAAGVPFCDHLLEAGSF